MGLKNAAAYFQKAMVTEVLNEIVHHGCEIYLDDCIVHGTTDDDFIQKLTTVLRCCDEHNIVLSPSKCELGSDDIEILGHTVNQKGLHFYRSKLDKVLNFPLPTTGGQLLSFVCLCNFFRKHVRDIAALESPLRRVAEAYKGTRKIPWDTPELHDTKTAFYKMQEEVGKCPKLFFYDETSPVYLHTDACDHGMGAYLYQVNDKGEELPIGFMSKSFHDAELGWSTFEQEGYAIHEALKKFHYLLRDIPFIIKTDHRNLLFLNQDASPKVLRWKWDVQQYNFKVEHIPGKENVIADLMSRLCLIASSEGKRQFKAPKHVRTKRKQNLRSRQRRAMLKQIEETQKVTDEIPMNPATILATLTEDTLRVKSQP